MSSSHGELCVAIINNNRSLVTKILSQKIDLSVRIPWDSITLKPASSRKKSVKKKEESNVYEALALNLAVIFSSVEVVEELVRHGANPMLKDGRSRSAIICAIYGDLDTLVISPENFIQITACNERHVHMINILLKGSESFSYSDLIQHANAPQEGPFLRGITPLCLAAYLGKVDIVGKLIDMGVSVDSTDKNGASALMYAVRDGHITVVHELLSKNASIELRDNNGWKAAQYGKKFPEIMRLLEDSSLQKIGANNIFPAEVMAEIQAKYPSFFSDLSSFLEPYGDLVAKRKSVTKTLQVQTEELIDQVINFQSLASCVPTGNVHGLKVLLDRQNNAANLRDQDTGLPILLYVLRYRPLRLETCELMVKILVASGADLQAVDIMTGMNALHFLLHDPFLLNDDEKLIESTKYISQIALFLAQHGCPVDVADSLGNRPLHYACQLGDWKTVRLLVHDYSSDLLKPNSNGKIPLDFGSSEEIRDFLTAEMRQKGKVPRNIMLDSFSEVNLQIEPLQRIQQFLLRAFEDASSVLSQELNREQVYDSVMNSFESDTPLIFSNSVIYNLDVKVNQLQEELQEIQVSSSKSIEERDELIINLESKLQSLKNSNALLQSQLESSNLALVDKTKQVSEIESQFDTVKKSLVKSTEMGCTLSSQFKDAEKSRSQKLLSLQTRVLELENLARRKDDVIKQMGETKRVVDNAGRPKYLDGLTDSSKMNQLHLHKDILKANLDAVLEDLRILKSANESVNDQEIQRLEKEQADLEWQMSQVMKEETHGSTPNRLSRGFMHLEDLLGQLQVNTVEVSPPYTPNGSPSREMDDGQPSPRMSYRMSTIFNQEECDLDPTLVNRLLDAAKRKIQRLKRKCETMEEEAAELKSQVEQKDIHIKDTYGLLQTANRRAAEVESKLSRKGADQDKFNMKLRDWEKSRTLELSRLRKIIEEFIGPCMNDDNEAETLQGILGMIHSLFLELDPVLLGSLPSHLVNPTVDDMIQLAEFSEDSVIDTRRYNSHLLQALTDVASRIKEYLNHLGSALGSMKTENKKFVKEIMKLKKQAVVKSLVANVRDSIGPNRSGRLELTEKDPRKKHVVPLSPSSVLSSPSTPVRPERIDRHSLMSHQSHAAVSEVSVAYSVSGMNSEASDIMESLKRLKLEISHLQALENPSNEAKTRVIELKQEYRGFVKRLMEVLKPESPSEAISSTSQELKDRLKKMSSSLTEIKESLTT